MMAYILFVDDEPQAAEFAAARLAGDGHRTTVVHDGQAAVDTMREEMPDILLLDDMLPRLHSYDVLREMHRWPVGKRPALIYVSMIHADGSPDHWWNAPVTNYLVRTPWAEHLGWQMVLAVEQLLYRRVTGPPEAAWPHS